MDAVSKLALAVVASAVILVGGYVGYHEYARARDMQQAQDALDQLRQNGAQAVAQARQSALAQQEQQLAYQRWLQARRQLALDQRCVDGAVVQIQGNSYTQVGTIEHPVHCNGRYADQPLR